MRAFDRMAFVTAVLAGAAWFARGLKEGGLSVAEHAPRLRADGREEAAVDGRDGCGHGGWMTSGSTRRRGCAADPATAQSDL